MILISALSPTELLVASKHSLGTSTVPRPTEEKETEKEDKGKEVVGSEGWKNEKEKEVVQKMKDVKLDDSSAEPEAAPTHTRPPEAVAVVKPTVGEEEDDESKKPSKNAKKREAKARYAAEQKALKASQTVSSSSPGEPGAGAGQGEEDEGQKMDGPGHATMGRRWLKVHLDRVGKEESDLAGVLWKEGVSCILEVSHIGAQRCLRGVSCSKAYSISAV